MKRFGIVFLLTLLFLSGCQSQVKQEVEQVNLPTITVGMECNYAPFNWTQVTDANDAVSIDGASGYCNGYDVQIARMIADGLNRQLIIKKIEWNGLEPALKSGVIDMIVAGMSPTPERQQSMNFSQPYFESSIVLVVRKDSAFANATSLNDFSGAKVVAQLGTFHDDLIEQISGVKHQTPMNDYPSMTVSLKSGRIDAITAEMIVAKSIAASNSDLMVVNFEDGKGFDLGSHVVTVAAALRQEDVDLLNDVNEIIATITPEMQSQIADDAIKNQPTPMPNGFISGSIYIIQEYSGLILSGVGITLLISLVGTIVGFLLGLVISALRNIRGLKILLNLYIEILRGTPMIVQAMIVYYGLATIGFYIPTLVAGLIIVSVNTSAYMAEIIRGGIQSVDTGQFEAAKAIGMTYRQMMIKVIFPQAIKNVLPAIGNEFIVNIKDTSVLNVISVSELFFQARTIAGIHYRTAETFFVVSAVYLILTFTITRLMTMIEKKMMGEKSYSIPGSQTVPSAIINKKNNH